jgi:exodeoxyribonuclease VII large subunit
VQVREAGQRLDELEARLRRALERSALDAHGRLGRLAAAVNAANPGQRIVRVRERVRWATDRLQRALQAQMAHATQRLLLSERALSSLSPLATLQRGYAIVARRNDGAILTDSAAAAPGLPLSIRLARGTLAATVDEPES